MASVTLTNHSFGCIAFGILLGASAAAGGAYGYIKAIPVDNTTAQLISRCTGEADTFVEIKLPDGSQCSYAPSEKLLALPVGRQKSRK